MEIPQSLWKTTSTIWEPAIMSCFSDIWRHTVGIFCGHCTVRDELGVLYLECQKSKILYHTLLYQWHVMI